MQSPTPHPLHARNPRDLLPARGKQFLERLVQLGLLDDNDRETFLEDRLDRLREFTSDERLGQALLNAQLLTLYQFERVLTGATHGLTLGSYRVLDELGKGGMGVVYLAEHRMLKRRVAIKVLPLDDDIHVSIKQRFYAEMRALAELSHPNIVLALDAGEVPSEGNGPPLLYLVMEFISGGDLEKHVLRHGLLPYPVACNYIRQAAEGLQAAHDRHLIHRDLKPSNLLLSSAGVVKLVDFGLARQFASRLTDQRALLGSVEFMPPEQSHDPSIVGKEADIYGLGATLFWLITGEGPYPPMPSVAQSLRYLQQQEPRRLRSLRPDVPEALDTLLARLLDRNPSRRPPSALAVVNALRPFQAENTALLPVVQPARRNRPTPRETATYRALIVDPELRTRVALRGLLEPLGCACAEARDGRGAYEAASRESFDLVLLSLELPDIDGAEVSRRLAEAADNPNQKIIVVSDKGGALPVGACDRLSKHTEPEGVVSVVRRALELKTLQDRNAQLTDRLLTLNQQLEQSLLARRADVREAHNALLFTMAKMAESRDGETPGHLRRMQLYTRTLAVEAAKAPPWQGLVDQHFLDELERCVPLHDIGKIGLPDEILLKPATLTQSERSLVETHTVIGDSILEVLGKEHGSAMDFLTLSRVIVRHHHERYDGKGYPDQLKGEAIPPAARLVAVADVYDALRRMRLYKPAMTHTAAIRTMLDRSPGQFDPTLVAALQTCQGEFERIYRENEE